MTLFLAMLLAAPPAAEGLFSQLPENPLQGSHLFVEKGCLDCHAIQGSGGRGGPDLGKGLMHRPLLEIAGLMWNHSPRMDQAFSQRHVERPKFESAEMASLLAFLYYLGSFDEIGDAREGARLFEERQCVRCHSVGSAGGRSGPALDKFGVYASPLYLTAALWNAGPGMSKKMSAMGIPRPTFEGKEISDLLAYLRQAGGDLARVYARPGNPRRGEELFAQKRCSACHPVDAQGRRSGPDLGGLGGSLLQIAGAMWNHGPGMWSKMSERGIAVPKLAPEEAADLVSYLYFLQFVDAPGDATRGLQVYRDARCVSCHEAVADGKRAAKSLTSTDHKFGSSLELVASMWNHGPKMERVMAESNLAWPQLHGTEMADLIAYLFAEQAKPKEGGTP